MEKKEAKICSFFGHRDIQLTEELYAITAAEIEKAVDAVRRKKRPTVFQSV